MDQKTLNLLKENLKDPSLYNTIYDSAIKRARTTAIVLGSFLILALISVMYAFAQQTKYHEAVNFSKEQNAKLELCLKDAQKQMGLAAEARIVAEEANRMALEQLKACEQRNKK